MGDKMIVYRFDKERFNKNADKGIKRILSKHLDYIDNLEVKFIDGEEWGTVENYVVGQERYCLYPVKKEWCSIEEQLRIIWNYCELSDIWKLNNTVMKIYVTIYLIVLD